MLTGLDSNTLICGEDGGTGGTRGGHTEVAPVGLGGSKDVKFVKLGMIVVEGNAVDVEIGTFAITVYLL